MKASCGCAFAQDPESDPSPPVTVCARHRAAFRNSRKNKTLPACECYTGEKNCGRPARYLLCVEPASCEVGKQQERMLFCEQCVVPYAELTTMIYELLPGALHAVPLPHAEYVKVSDGHEWWQVIS